MSPFDWLDRETSSLIALVLWQVTWSGTLLSGGVLLAMRCLGPGAKARYALSCASLAALLMLAPIWAVVDSLRAASVPVDSHPEAREAGIGLAESGVDRKPLEAGVPTAATASASSSGDTLRSPAVESPEGEPSRVRAESKTPSWPDRGVQGITLAYGLGLLVMLVRLVMGVWGGERLRTAGRPVQAAAILDLLAERARQVGLRVVPALRTCERVAGPVVVGILRPVILLPASMLTGLSPQQLGAVLAHELAHLRRHDHLVLLGQRIAETLLFFHPAVWYLSRQIDDSREECCDDLVLTHGVDSIDYVRSLLRVAELRLESMTGSPLTPLSGLSVEGANPSSLRRRIMRLIGAGPAPVMRLTRTGIVFLIGSIAGLISLSLLFAETAAKPSAPAVVRFADGVELELMGLARHPSAGEPWWKPDGTPLEQGPKEGIGGQLGGFTPDEAARCRELWAVVRGASAPVHCNIMVDGDNRGWLGHYWYDDVTRLYTIHRASGPIESRRSTRVRIGLSIANELPLRTFSLSGEKTIPGGPVPAAIREFDDMVQFQEIRESKGVNGDEERVELVVSAINGLGDRASIEFLAHDVNGVEIRANGSVTSESLTNISFKVARSKLSRFSYRLRLYTHRATFENVSLEPGRTTDVQQEGHIETALLVNPPASPAEQAKVVKQLRDQGALFRAALRVDGAPMAAEDSRTRNSPVVSCDLVSPEAQSLWLLSRLTDLEELQIMGCRTREGLESIGRLKKLKRLELINCQWTAADFAILSTLPNLETLTTNMDHQLSLDTPWYKEQIPEPSAEQAAFIADRLKLSGNPSVTEMCCYDAFLNDEGLRVLVKLPRLRHLELTNAYITDAGFRRITALPELRVLEVNGGFLTEEGLRTIAKCQHLESIDVGWGPWSAAALEDLGRIKSLRKMRLWHPSIRVSPASLAQLRGALPGAEVVLSQHPEVPPLEFRLVANEADSDLKPQVPADWKSKKFRQNTVEGTAEETPGFAWFPIRKSIGENHNIPIVVGKRQALLSDLPKHMLAGDGSWSVVEAKVSNDRPGGGGGRSVAVRLDKAGGDQLRKLTEAHLRARLAIVVDGTIVMAPTINSTIGDRLEITGNFSEAEAKDLAAALLKRKKNDRAEETSDSSAVPQPATIAERLAGPVELAAVDKPLIHILSDLETRYGVPITMDLGGFLARGISPQKPISLKMSGVSLRSAFKVLLEAADPTLDFEANDKGIRIPGRGDRTLLTAQVVSRVTGQPVAGAMIRTEYRDADWRVQRDTARPSGFQAPLATRQARTDSEGKYSFVLPPVCEGKDIAVSRIVSHPDFVVLKADGYRALTQSSLKDPDELQRGFGKITLDPGRLVEGEVRLPDGRPASGVPVYVAREYVEYVGSPPLSLTDAAGRYRVRVPSGDEKYRVSLLPWSPGKTETGLVRFDEPLRAGEDEPTPDEESLKKYCAVSLPIGKSQTLPIVTLKLGVIVQGQVVDSSGKGVPNVGVQGDGADSVFRNDERPLLMARTDQRGLYRLPPIPEDVVIDVRVKDEAWFGPWQSRGAILKDAYLPALSSQARRFATTTGSLIVDFKPAPVVMLTARWFTGDEPRTDAHLEFYGFPPGREDTRWRGRFHDVPGQPGVQQLLVPKGLAHAALDLWQDRDERVATATRVASTGEPQAGRRIDVRYEVVNSDDDSIEVRSPAKPAPAVPALPKPAIKEDAPIPAGEAPKSGVPDANKPEAAMIHIDVEAPEADVALIEKELASLKAQRILIRVVAGNAHAARIAAAQEVPFSEVNGVIEKLQGLGVTNLSISELKGERRFDPQHSSVTWIRRGSLRSGGEQPRTQLAIRHDGWAIAPADHRTRESRIRLTPEEIDTLVGKLWDDCHLPEIAGEHFNGQPDLWSGSQDTIVIHHAGKDLTLSCEYGWPSDTRDGHVENFLKALHLLSQTKGLVAAGGRESLLRVLPLVNEGIQKIHPAVPPLEIRDFMAAETYPSGTCAITLYRERGAGGEVEKVRAEIEVPDEGEPNLLSIELNGQKTRTERPPRVPGVDLTAVPIGGRWHEITDVYEQRPNESGEIGRFFRVRPGVRTIDIGKNLEAHILPGGKSFYIEHADQVRRNVYGPIEGDVAKIIGRKP